MRLSNPSKTVVRGDSSLARVLDYTPKKFDLGISAPALGFQELRKRSQNDFRMSEPVRMQTGLDKIDAQETEDTVERRTLEKLKEIQEGAYQEAHKLGLEEGRKEAFTELSEKIDKQLSRFSELITTVENLKSELLKQNESHILKLAVHIATRLAQHEVEVNNDCIVQIMRQALQDAQLDEEVVVQVASAQFEFLEGLKKETGREFEFLKKVKLVPDEGLRAGGCVIETNYGIIDARLEERVGKLWESMTESLYRIKDKIGAA